MNETWDQRQKRISAIYSDALRGEIRRRGMTMETVGERAGLSQQEVSKSVKSGATPIKAARYFQLLLAMGFDLDGAMNFTKQVTSQVEGLGLFASPDGGFAPSPRGAAAPKDELAERRAAQEREAQRIADNEDQATAAQTPPPDPDAQ